MIRLVPCLLLFAMLQPAPLAAVRCRVDSVASVHRLVSEADVVARVVVIGPLERAGADPNQSFSLPPDRIELRVLEVLKGQGVPARLAIFGRLSSQNDFNDREPPYDFVRPSGRSGNCYATYYRAGAEYLMILREKDGHLTPYWAPLAPTNEQVHGRDDPWVWWMRGYLSSDVASG